MNGYDGPRAMRFKDGRTGLLSPFGLDRDGVYEVTDSTAWLAGEYLAAGLIEYVDGPADDTPAPVVEVGEADEPADDPADEE